jgi:spore coat polysaccharide biosynthesis protein SpsF
MKVVAIIQARMGSTRLPGKVLADVAGQPMLWWVCQRTRRAARVDQVVVATTLEPDDRQIVDQSARIEVPCFRGSTDDVLRRYAEAARAFEADAIIRITADCPLIDSDVIQETAQGYCSGTREAGKAHCADREDGEGAGCLLRYASNTLERTWPRGLDTEVMSAAALARADREAIQPDERAHVTPYVYRHPELFQLISVTGPDNLADMRWTVDTPEDLEFVRAIYSRLAGNEWFSWRDVLRLLEREPALAEINRHIRQKQIAEG